MPPAGLWESAAPEDRTKAYGAIRPDAPAPAASSGPPAGSAAPPGERAARRERAAARRGAARARAAGRRAAAPRARRRPRAAPRAAASAAASGGRGAAGRRSAAAGAAAAPPPAPGAPPPPPVRQLPSHPPPSRIATPAPADPVLRAAADAATRTTSTVPKPPVRDGFVSSGAIRAAAEEMGLRLPAGVYAGLAAALAGGRHVVIVGPPGAGKTTLALAVAKAGAQAGKTNGASLVTAGRRWTGHDTLGRAAGDDWEAGSVVSAARRNRWLIIDELDRAALDRALGDLSSFLGGVPVALPDGETVAPDDWRVVATAAGAAARLVRPRPALRARSASRSCPTTSSRPRSTPRRAATPRPRRPSAACSPPAGSGRSARARSSTPPASPPRAGPRPPPTRARSPARPSPPTSLRCWVSSARSSAPGSPGSRPDGDDAAAYATGRATSAAG